MPSSAAPARLKQHTINFDVRIGATNRGLQQAAKKGEFRLAYFSGSTFPAQIPATV
jgi:transcriptional regulator with GAF, ATPase, and Fis domain